MSKDQGNSLKEPFSNFRSHVDSKFAGNEKKKKSTYIGRELPPYQPTVENVREINENENIKTTLSTVLRDYTTAQLHQQKHEEYLESNRPKKKSKLPKEIEFNEPSVVKLNTAAILREEKLYQKKQEKEARLLQRYEMELRDASEFYEWKEKEEKKEHQIRLKRVKELREEMRQADINAKLAKIAQEKENLQVAQEYKEQLGSQLKKFKKESDKKLKKQKVQIKQRTAKDKKKRKIAKKKVKKTKKKLAKKVMNEKKINQLKIEREKEKEMEVIKDRIMKIRAVVKVPVTEKSKMKKKFDPTEATNNHLTCGMSHFELKKRVKNLSKVKEREVNEKRDRIRKLKEKKQKKLREKVERISHFRNLAKNQRIRMKEVKKRKDKLRAVRAAIVRDEKIQEFATRLKSKEQKKIDERKQRIESEKLRVKKMNSLQLDKTTYQQKKWSDVLDGKARKVREAQQREFIENQKKREIDDMEREIRVTEIKKGMEVKKEVYERYDAEVSKSKMESTVEKQIELEFLKGHVQEMRKYERETVQKLARKKNPMQYGVMIE